uniref:Ig-like domain-containing protein n=1 Tax=Aeromonas veronii TaxID=654 RepID=UPI003B9EC055
ATKDNITSNQVSVEVTDAVITALQVTPERLELNVGQSRQILAIATYSDQTTVDISNRVSWLRSEPAVITVTSNGLVNGIKAGHSTVTASYDGIFSAPIQAMVLNSVAVPTLSFEAVFYTASGKTEANASLEYRYNDEVLWRSVDTPEKFNLDLNLIANSDADVILHARAVRDGSVSGTTSITIPAWRLIKHYSPSSGTLKGRKFAIVDKGVTSDSLDGAQRFRYHILDCLINNCQDVTDVKREATINGKQARVLTLREMEELHRSSNTNGAPSGWPGECPGWCTGAAHFYWTSTRRTSDYHFYVDMFNGESSADIADDGMSTWVKSGLLAVEIMD